MRYVMLAAAIGLLVVGPVVFVAQAAAGTKTDEVKTNNETTLMDTEPMLGSYLQINEAQRQAYLATVHQKQQEQKERQEEQRRQEAGRRFGQWGPDLVEAAGLYGQDPGELYRVMSCESGGDPYADNGVNKGLFQFHPGTFAGTPYGSASIFDGRAQIMAAAWMWSQGRKGEWGCA